MAEIEVYMVDTEVTPPQEVVEEQGIVGAFVNCFTLANDEGDAEKRVVEALEEDGYKVINIEAVSAYWEVEWEEEEDKKINDEFAKEALSSNDVVYAEFFGYETTD